MHTILWRCQQKLGSWVGSSVVHLGDHNVPNALMFIDKVCLSNLDDNLCKNKSWSGNSNHNLELMIYDAPRGDLFGNDLKLSFLYIYETKSYSYESSSCHLVQSCMLVFGFWILKKAYPCKRIILKSCRSILLNISFVQYNQVPRILTPVVLVLDKLPSLSKDKHVLAYVESICGDIETAR